MVVLIDNDYNETAFAAPEGISELIDKTNKLMPEGIKASESDVSSFKLNRKRALAHSVVGVSTTSAATIGAVPIPFSDALLLGTIEVAQIRALAQIYGINKDKDFKVLMNAIVEVGTVSVAAKTLISSLKAIPGIHIAASVLNAIIAGAIVAAIGEGSVYAFEKIYIGEKQIEDIEWVKKVIESNFSSQFIENVTAVIENIAKSGNTKDIGKLINALLPVLFRSKS